MGRQCVLCLAVLYYSFEHFGPQCQLLLSSGLVVRPLITALLQRAGHPLGYSLEETRVRAEVRCSCALAHTHTVASSVRMRWLRCESRRQCVPCLAVLYYSFEHFGPQCQLLLSSGLVFRPLITELLQRAGHPLGYSLEETRVREAYALRHASRLPTYLPN